MQRQIHRQRVVGPIGRLLRITRNRIVRGFDTLNTGVQFVDCFPFICGLVRFGFMIS
jgi:hypothetical protein